ncbi:hypothetical protein SAMN03097699_3046 [Flavobacteriaceae bacterium MAR_2010_188]|nr:hypothetical protein SAMN03097699_3046 [Flavobacteriaceae bacterium MAR_2010_188]
MENRELFYLFVGLLTFLIYIITGELLVSAGLGLNIYFFLKYIMKLGKDIPLFELIILLLLSQWILGPFIDYSTNATDDRYFMYVDSESYFSFVVPGVLMFLLPIILLRKRIDLRRLSIELKKITAQNRKLPWILISIGLISSLLSGFVPGSLGFVFFLMSQFKYIGLIYMFFSDTKYDNYVLYIIFGATVLSSIQQGLFHDLILWGALFFTFLVFRYQWSIQKRLWLTFIGIFFAIITQSIKADYRSIVNENSELAGLETFSLMAFNQVTGEGIFGSPEKVNELNVRLNQGWIISAIMANIPDYEPFLDGATIEEAITSSLVPRFLVPDKKKAGGRENFTLFTGLEINEVTSMGTSIIGEAYGNYGVRGAWIFMGLWGLFLVVYYNAIRKFADYYPSVLLWLPLIFLQVLKAETELSVVLNHLIKASVIVFGFFYFASRTLKWRL